MGDVTGFLKHDRELPERRPVAERLRDWHEVYKDFPTHKVRTQAARSVNTAHVCANWLIGQQIVEAEQGGAKRAAYGKALLKALSEQLSAEYGAGFSVSALQYMRSFFLGYPQLLAKQHAVRVVLDVRQIQHAVRGESPGDRDVQPGVLNPSLSWTHYRKGTEK